MRYLVDQVTASGQVLGRTSVKLSRRTRAAWPAVATASHDNQ
ncbi:hypothetical protein [Asanoa hainanensis]|nr:hypothetical protein [Asanoa hainanensis]